MTALEFIADDLAPGDRKCAKLDTSLLSLSRIHSGDDPQFDAAYKMLQKEFEPCRHIERAAVLQKRFEWEVRQPVDQHAAYYEMIVARAGERIAAVRDHVIIIRDNAAVVRLSHFSVSPDWRQTGLIGWMRALPIQTARHCLQEAGYPADAPITLVAEVEMNTPKGLARVQACEDAGYLKVDPRVVPYVTPDFRAPEEIDAAGRSQQIPYSLVLRRVGREAEKMITGKETRWLVESLYLAYARECRPQEMEACWRLLPCYPSPWSDVELIMPTS